MWKASIETSVTEDEIIATFDKHPRIVYELSAPVNGNTGVLLKSDSILSLFYYLAINKYDEPIEEL